MAATYQLEVVAPDQRLWQGQAQSLVAPGVEGYLGVLAHHAPLMCALGVGELKLVTAEGQQMFFALTGGFLEVSREGAIVLADAAERPEEIDAARARAALRRAEERLSRRTPDLDADRARAALMRALNRLRVAERRRRAR